MKKQTFLALAVVLAGVSWGQSPINYEFINNLNPGTGNDIGIDVERLNDGNFVFISTKEISTGNNDVEIRKINPHGTILWTINYGGSSDERAGEIQPTSDGGFVVSGSSVSYGGSGQNMMLLKYNSNGVLQWQQFYSSLGLASTVKPINGGAGGFRVGGNGVVITDASGNQTNYISVSGGTVSSLTNTSDGGFALVTRASSSIKKYNAGNSLQWSQSFAAEFSTFSNTYPYEILQTASGDLAVCGLAFLSPGTNAFFKKFDLSGNEMISEVYSSLEWAPLCNVHGTTAYDMVPTSDGGFILAGSAETGNPTLTGTTTCYIKINSNGQLGDISLSIEHTWLARGNVLEDYYATVQGICLANPCGDAFISVGHEQLPTFSSSDIRVFFQKFYDQDYNTPSGSFAHVNYDYTYLEINANTTWDGIPNSKTVAGKVVVKSPNTLTIKNGAVLEMGLCGKIIVEEGARLIVDNAKITSLSAYDESMWHGIDVWGTRTLSQYTSGAQGQVIVKNNAVIENAITAITTIRDVNNIGPSGWDWNATGGVITASNSTFLNNGRDIQFLSYQNFSPVSSSNLLNNKSSFVNVNFKVDGQLRRPGTLPTYRVTMYDVTGLYYSGCVFENTALLSENSGVRGGGINAVDAKFTVRSSCNVLTPYPNPCPTSQTNRSKFDNFSEGIKVSNATVSTRNITVDRTDFTNCNKGVYISGADFSLVTRSTFEIPNGSISFPGLVATYGLYLDQSQSFKCEENDFFGVSASSSSNFNFGVIINNSLSGASTVYRNNFKNLVAATLAQRDNYDGSTGLKINCDIYNFSGEENLYDVAVTGGTVTTEIHPFQGTCTSQPVTQVRNSYGAICAGNDNHYYVDKLSPNPILHADYTSAQPACSHPDVLLWNCTPGSPANCPSTLNTVSKLFLKSQIALNEQLMEQESILLQNGDSQDLFDAISTASNGVLLQDLLSYSPYLSDDVLVAYLNRKGIPNGHVKQVILANSPLSDKVYGVVESLNLPSGVMNQIDAAQVGFSGRTEQEAIVSHYQFERALAVNDLIRYFLNDTTEDNGLDSVEVILKNENWTNARCKLVDVLIDQGKYAEAIQELDDLDVHHNDPSLQNFCAFKRIAIELNQTIEKCYVIRKDDIKQQTVESIAYDDEKYECKNAQALLSLVFGTRFEEDVIPPGDADQKSASFSVQDESKEIAVEEGQVRVYPNPANEQLFVEYVFDSQDSYSLVIYDLLGNTLVNRALTGNQGVAKIDLIDFPQGVYICGLNSGDQLVKRLKFVVSK